MLLNTCIRYCTVTFVLLFCFCTIGLTKAQAEYASPSLTEGVTAQRKLVQGLIGVMEFTDDTYTRTDSNGDSYLGKMPTIPVLGGMWQFGFIGGDTVSLGLETGILFGFDSYSTTLIGGGNGLYIHIKNQFFLIDGMVGLNLDIHPTNKFRLYAGAGPMLMFANLKTDNNDDEAGIDVVQDESSSATDIGLYARIGAEFKITQTMLFGFQARYVDAELDFGQELGQFNMSGIQYMLTFTSNF